MNTNKPHERKSNQEVFEIVSEKCSLIDSIRVRRWRIVRHTLRNPEELHSSIIEGTIEGKSFSKHVYRTHQEKKWRVTVENREQELQTSLRVEQKIYRQCYTVLFNGTTGGEPNSVSLNNNVHIITTNTRWINTMTYIFIKLYIKLRTRKY